MFQKLKQLFAGFAIILGITGLLIAPAYAADPLTPTKATICQGDCPVTNQDFSKSDRNSIATIIINVARFVTFVGVALAILFMVWGGIRFITANGGDGAAAGKKILIEATIGLIIAIVAYTIVNIVAGLVQGNLLGNVTSTSGRA